jgi:hypothetical protein
VEEFVPMTIAKEDAVNVVPVEGRALWRAFHRLPHQIYKDDPAWIAPLTLERESHFDKAHNPFFQHAKGQFWLALRQGQPVGRITAQIDALYLAQHNDATGHFGFIEGIDDPDVFAALLGTAEAWLKAEGMRRAAGPISFAMWDEPGLLVDGFETPPSVMMGHALPYYGPRILGQGYTPLQDLLAYDFDVQKPFPRAMMRLVERAENKQEFHFRPARFDRKHFDSEIALILDVMNDAWAENWGFVPMTKAEIDDIAVVFKYLLRPDAVVIAEYEGEAAGFAMVIPNLNEAARDLKGRLFPLGFLKLLWRLKVRGVSSGRMAMMGIRRKWWLSPAGAILALMIIYRAKASDFAKRGLRAELSWILDSNERIKHVLQVVGATPYKRYRIYEKAL